jgi:hypothetical protein
VNSAAAKAITLLDALRASFEAAGRSPDGMARPVALLWPDPDAQWEGVVAQLKATMTELYSMGSYSPKERQGPVIWLKCVVDRAIPEFSVSEGAIPVLYLPRVSRQQLRAGADCPAQLQPLVELQFRGSVWHQRNGRDWSVDAFLSGEQGLGLDIAQDGRTREAMLRALPLLALEPIESLRRGRLEAEDFDRLMVNDPARDVLSWLSDPKGFESRRERAAYESFRDVCKREFGFDPDKDGPLAAADALLNADGKWQEVWKRFGEAPGLYTGIAQRLREARPRDLLADRSRQPTHNDEQEKKLRADLQAAAGLPHHEACRRILALEAEHRERRDWVWARIGQSPLAMAMAPLARLATLAATVLSATSVEAMANDYAAEGYRCDRAALEALNGGKPPAEAALVGRVVRSLYEPWLDGCARRLQQLASGPGKGLNELVTPIAGEKDTCLLFADGLRFDVGRILAERLEARGYRVKVRHRIAPTPTVTATAKPAVSPASTGFVAGESATDFAPVAKASGQPVTAPRLRAAMSEHGVEVLQPGEARYAPNAEGGGWMECGRLDEIGHALGLRLAGQIDTEIEGIADRVAELLSAGWMRVRIVTDHGWLLMPGGLPKVELRKYLTETRWTRCAVVSGDTDPGLPVFPWYWERHVRIACPPGIGAFKAGEEYSHGGVSLQECVTPDLLIERGEERAQAKLASIAWRGMRCRIVAAPATQGLRVDLRFNWKQPGSSIAASAKDLDGSGEASLAVADDSHEGAAAMVVLLDSAGNVLDYKPTTVGESK